MNGPEKQELFFFASEGEVADCTGKHYSKNHLYDVVVVDAVALVTSSFLEE